MARSEESIRKQKETAAARKAARDAVMGPAKAAGKQKLRAARVEARKQLTGDRKAFFAEYARKMNELLKPVRAEIKRDLERAKKEVRVPLTPEEIREMEEIKLLRQEKAKIREKEKKLKEERARLKEKVRAEIAARHASAGGGEYDAEEDGSENGAVDEQADDSVQEYQAAE